MKLPWTNRAIGRTHGSEYTGGVIELDHIDSLAGNARCAEASIALCAIGDPETAIITGSGGPKRKHPSQAHLCVR